MRRIPVKLWVFLFVLILAGLYGYRTWGPYPITNEKPSGRAIIAFGDSLTFGTGASPETSYPAQLMALIRQPVVNRGAPGETTADALKRLQRDVLDNEPKIVLLCLGGNDLLRRVDADQTFSHLKTMITRIQEKGALVILIGLSGAPLSPSLNGRYKALARETGCPCVPDVLDGILGERDLMADQVHPNARGYAIMAERIRDAMAEYL